MKPAVSPAKGPERRVGLTPTRIVDEALRLSRAGSLDSWTVRDLAAALDVSPSVIYHHTGGKPEILRQVVARVTAAFAAPDPELAWEEYFRALLLQAYPIVREVPGTARWLVMHGPSFRGLRAHFDAGLAALQRAGFERPAMVYALLLNSAMLTVAMSDDRQAEGEDGPRDHTAMRDGFAAHRDESAGMRLVVDELLVPLTEDPVGAARALTAEYYQLLVDSLLAGLAQQLG